MSPPDRAHRAAARAVGGVAGGGIAERASLPLERRFREHLAASGLLSGARRVLVALSGGLDSVCLLHLLRFGRPGFEVEAAHYDHGMRAGSEADARWVAGLCRAWSVALSHARAREAPASEAAARDLRYAYLGEAAMVVGADAIVTAHHADDQAETVLLRLLRGTGLPGLVGIAERRGPIVRPLLPFARAELEVYAARMRLAWRDDPTNRQLRYGRNRIRHELLPALEAARPGAATELAELAALAAVAEQAWQSVVGSAVADIVMVRDEAGFVLARDRLLAYHPHVCARTLRHLLRELGSQPDRPAIRSAVAFARAGASGRRIELPGRITLEREFDRLRLRRWSAESVESAAGPRAGSAADTVLEIRGVERGGGTFVVGGRRYTASWSPANGAPGAASSAVFDSSTLRFPLALRGWRAGDRVRLAYGTKKLTKVFAERRIGRELRRQVPVLSDAAGAVLWVVGVVRSIEAVGRDGPRFTITVADGELRGRA